MRPSVSLLSARPRHLRFEALCVAFAASRSIPYSIVVIGRTMSSTTKMEEKFAPAKRVAGQKQDVWYVGRLASHVKVYLTCQIRSIVNEAAAASPKQPIGVLN